MIAWYSLLIIAIASCSRSETNKAQAPSRTNDTARAHHDEDGRTGAQFDVRLFDELLGRFVDSISDSGSQPRFDPVKAQESSFAELVTIVTSCPDPLVAYQYGVAALARAPDAENAARIRLWTARHALRLWDLDAAEALVAEIPADASSSKSENYYVQRLDMEIAVAEARGDFASAARRKEAKARLKLQYVPWAETPHPQMGKFSRYAGFLLAAARDYILAGEYEKARALYDEVLSADPNDPGYDNVVMHQRVAEQDLQRLDELVQLRATRVARARESFDILHRLYEQHGAAWLAELQRACRASGRELQAWELYALENKMKLARTLRADMNK